MKAVRRLSTTVLLLTGVGLLPPIQARGKALATLAEAVGLPFPRPFAPPVERVTTSLDGIQGDLYLPGAPAPPLVLIPGAAPKGRRDPRVVRVARAFARADRVVFVPDLALADREFVEEDIDRIVRAVAALDEHPVARGTVGLLGFSYGGSFGLVAAADPRIASRLGVVGVFGAYFDLVGVVQAVTTGVSVVGGRRIPWQGHPRARDILHEVAVRLAPVGERAALEAALEGPGDPASLPPGARAAYELVTNRDPSRTEALAAALPAEARHVLEAFSPSSVAGEIRAPVVAMHSTDDPAVPYGEALRLVGGIDGTRLVTVSLFRHVDFRVSSPGAWARASGDLWRAWRFASWLVTAQE